MYQQSRQRLEDHPAARAENPFTSATGRGSITGLQSVVKDIGATRGHARQFWRVFETSRVPMSISDSTRRHLAANPAARLFFRLTLAEWLQCRIDDLTPPDKMPLLTERWERLMRTGAVAGPYDIRLPDGSELKIVYSAVANALPGQHLIVFAPAGWPGGELVDLEVESPTQTPSRALSRREREVLYLIATGADRQEIAIELTISVATVRTHVRNILRKLNARNRAHAIALAMQQGLLEISPEWRGQSPEWRGQSPERRGQSPEWPAASSSLSSP